MSCLPRFGTIATFLMVSVCVNIFASGTLCPVPPNFPGADTVEDWGLVEDGVQTGFVESLEQFDESPIVSWGTFGIGLVQWDCMATYQLETKALVTGTRPVAADLVIANRGTELEDDNTRNADILACYAIANYVFGRYTREGTYPPIFQAIIDEWGYNLTKIDQSRIDAEACNLDETCLEGVAAAYDYCPDAMGAIVAVTSIDFLTTSGFNALGDETPFGPCTANCRNFSDPIGLYDPRVKLSEVEAKLRELEGIDGGEDDDDDDDDHDDDDDDDDEDERGGYRRPRRKRRTILTGRLQRNKFPWQPLLEDDGAGFFFRQEHVTPHVGFNVNPISISKVEFQARDALISDPEYDYEVEAPALIERVRLTALSDERKAKIVTFDDKAQAGALIQRNNQLFFRPTYEQNVVFEVGNRIVEWEATLLAWRAKVIYNLIRPTTVVQSLEFNDEIIETWGGPFAGVQNISARDFQPYIRTMPHAEFPSGSACICSMWEKHISKYVVNEYAGFPYPPGVTPGSFPFFFVYLDFEGVDPEPEGPQRLYQEFTDIIGAMTDCGQSRLWGGMDFGASVPASENLCASVGEDIYDFLQDLLGSNAGDLRKRHLQHRELNDAPDVDTLKANFDGSGCRRS